MSLLLFWLFLIIISIIVFGFLIPFFLRVIEKITRKKVKFNLMTVLIGILITVFCGTALFAQLLLKPGESSIVNFLQSMNYNNETILSESQIQEQKRKGNTEKLRIELNTQIYIQLKPQMSLSIYDGCRDTYKWLEGEHDYQLSSSFSECKKTERFCLAIQSLYDVNYDYKEELVVSKALCERFGWYSSSNRYSKDFNLN